MADTHSDDPNTPPIHYELRERFAQANYIIATVLGLGATAAGIVLGIILVND